MPLWYHGTNKEEANVILKEGFKVGTFFSKHMESALQYGGEYMFVIFFEENPTEYWEFVSNEVVLPSEILILHVIKSDKLYYSKEVEKRNRYQFHKEINPGKKICTKCEGKGELGDFDYGDRVKNRKVKVCPICKGHGVENYWGDKNETK